MSEAGNQDDAPGRADRLFAEFLDECQRGGEMDSFVARHPAQANALRAMHSLWLAGNLGDSSAATESEAIAPTQELDGLSGALQALAAAPSESVKPVAEHIPHFKLVEVLGEGGFGVVWKAEQEWPIRRTVAIKIVKLGMDSHDAVARFEAERQALALMSHPAIARVYDAGATQHGRPYFVMELIHGQPITSFCDQHGLNVDERLTLFLIVCDAVAHAHQKGVIHRDLKPSNVLVGLDGGKPVPKVIDFGIAKAIGQELTEHTLQTGLGQIIGTPAYMSPEQADTSRVDIDTRSDIYSLGALLYELLAGAPPFDRETLRQKGLEELLRFVREAEPKRPSLRAEQLFEEGQGSGEAHLRSHRLVVRRLRGDLDWIVLKAMAKERDRRYPTVSELAADIHRHLQHEPVLARPPSVTYRLRKLGRKHRGAVGVALTLLILALTTLGGLAHRAESRVRALLDRGWNAVEERKAGEAQGALAALLPDHYGRPTVRDLKARVEALELELRAEESARHLAQAEQDWERHRSQLGTSQALEKEWEQIRKVLATHAPPWEREEEMEAHQRLVTARQEEQTLYHLALAGFQRAIEAAPRDSTAEIQARKAFARADKEMADLADWKGSVSFSSEFFRRRGADLDPDLFAKKGGRVLLRSRPSGADVFCFRYQEREQRLLPLPFSPSAAAVEPEQGWLARPALVVAAVMDSSLSPFQAGDRIETVAGKSVELLGDLARAIEGLSLDAAVEARVVRSGKKVTTSWIPFPTALYAGLEPNLRLAPGKLLSTREQLGFLVEGYPLDCIPGASLGLTTDGAPLDVVLPDGSYLLVFRRQGYLETRFPLRIAARDIEVNVRVLPAEKVPAGFVHVPAGPFIQGGDPLVFFQASPLQETSVTGFLIARHEVTIEEYLEFLNDPWTGVDEQGSARPKSPQVVQYLQQLVAHGNLKNESLHLVPRWAKEEDSPLVVRGEPGRWGLRGQRSQQITWPVFGVSQLAAQEFAFWLTQKSAGGLVARFRLPTDAEWEKAARGVDQRHFVWGNYPLWSFSWTFRGIHWRKKEIIPVGLSPFDESVYGARDLIGSVSELVSDRPSSRYLFCSVRGGNWFDTDENYGPVPARNGLLPWVPAQYAGFRLVGELLEP